MEQSTEQMREAIRKIFTLQQENKYRIAQTSASERIEKLKRLHKAIFARQEEIQEAVYSDFRKCPSEVKLTEIFIVSAEIKHAVRRLKKWMKPNRVRPSVVYFGSKSYIRQVPKGVCLIITPWNYPFQLAVSPLVSAVAAGNCVMMKPSELSRNTSQIIRKLVADLFDENEAAVIEGGKLTGEALLELPFDHIFYTGSPAVGKKVMAAASRHPASVTLELGGKSPVVIDDTADLNEAAEKVIWGKLINCGQTCTAPDYVLITRNRAAEFVETAKLMVEKYYGDPGKITENPDYCRIISEKHLKRIKNLVEDAVKRGAVVETGGKFTESENFIQPTILSSVDLNSEIMSEEIFGPVLPVIPVESVDDALRIINSKPNPLALYIFSREKSAAEKILSLTSPGDAVINDTVVHFANPKLPFGGFNHSGIGKVHGEAGFRSFSHTRSVLRQPRRSPVQLLYPPYTQKVKKLIDLTLRYF